MEEIHVSTNRSITSIELLTIMLIGLKLTNKIDYPWWLVLSPLWLGVIFYAIAFVFIVIIKAMLAYIYEDEDE